MKAHTLTTDDDRFIPEPVWFAYQLGWCQGPQPAWSWSRLLDTAGRHFQANKPRQEQARAI